MTYSVEFRRLRAARPAGGEGIDIFGFTALSRGLQLVGRAVLAADAAGGGLSADESAPTAGAALPSVQTAGRMDVIHAVPLPLPG